MTQRALLTTVLSVLLFLGARSALATCGCEHPPEHLCNSTDSSGQRCCEFCYGADSADCAEACPPLPDAATPDAAPIAVDAAPATPDAAPSVDAGTAKDAGGGCTIAHGPTTPDAMILASLLLGLLVVRQRRQVAAGGTRECLPRV